MNETLSMRRAKDIVDTAANLVNSAIGVTRSRSWDFEANVAKIWEDEYAVDFIHEFWSKINDVLDNHKKSFTKCAETIKDVAEKYRQTGGMQEIVHIDTFLPTVYSTPMRPPGSTVQATFLFSDEFGFKNLETGPEEVKEAFETLESELLGIYDEMSSDMKSIHAFGNQNVQEALNSLWLSMMQNLVDNLKYIKIFCNLKVEEAANSYRKTGESSENMAQQISLGSN